jgi:hypothetical protein
MITFLLIFVVVECLITLTFMIMVGGWVSQIRPLKFQLIFIRLLKSRTSAFILNMAISVILSSFTGAGMYAGFANLTSSVIVAAIAPIVLEIRFRFKNVEEEVKRSKQTSRVKRSFTGLFKTV